MTQLQIQENKLKTLIKRIQENDQSSFREFFFIMQPSIYNFIFRYTCNKETAEDLTQETFIKLWIHRNRLDLHSSPKAYLYKIARNLALNHLERKTNPENFPTESDYLIYLSQKTEEDLDEVFFLDDFQNAINLLPERCKATFLLSRFGGFDYSEIAEIMDVSLQTVKNQMNKAISVLRKLLAHHVN
ncbi:MAG: RNA polymerase sigma factor [Ignavibacteriaceae bacterium]